MRKNLSRYAMVAIVAILAAVAALSIGRNVQLGAPHEGGRLHEIMHERLDLDPQQERAVDALETRFAERRKALNAQLRCANAELAQAIESEHEYGPIVERAVDRSHIIMGALQKETLSHVFAMRGVLRADQAEVFDEAVSDALTQTPQD